MLTAVLWAASTAAQPVASAPHSTAPDGAQDIVVTGERVSRSLRETPSSVVVFSSDDLEQIAGGDRVDELLALVPNVQFGSEGEGPSIRGQDSTGVLKDVQAFLGGARPRATLVVDGRPLNFYEFVFGSAPIWDVDRVEVFRTPQTTTQGRNSIAGALFVNTRSPTYAWEARTRFILGDARTRQASAVVSGPLIDDQLAFRAAGDIRLSRTSSRLADGITGVDIEEDDYRLARLKLLVEPRGLPGARLETSFVHLETQAPQFEAVRTPFRERRVLTPERSNGVYRTRVHSVTARLGYEISPALTSTATMSFGDGLVRRFGLPGLGQTRVNSRDRTIEGILNWRAADALGLLAGVSHFTNRQRQFIDITGLGIGAGGFRDRQSSLGVFGEASWRLAPPIALSVGARYQRDRQSRDGMVGTGARGIRLDYGETFDAFLAKFSASYDIADRATAGILIQRAYNPGGTTISLARRVEDRFEAETLWNYEAFFRGAFAGGKATLSANLFYNDIRNAQRPLTVEIRLPDASSFFATEFANAPAAEAYGLEVEAEFNPTRRLSIRSAVGLLDTKVRRAIVRNDPSLGKEFQKSPGFSAMGSIDWSPADRLQLSAQLRHNSGYFSDDANSRARFIERRTVVDARAAYTVGSATLSGYVRNAFNDFYLTYLFNPAFGTAGDPREFGVAVEARF